MINRRQFVKSAGIVAGSLLMGPRIVRGQTVFHYYLAPHVWNPASPGGGAWQRARLDIPGQALGLRSFPQMGLRTGIGYMLVAYESQVPLSTWRNGEAVYLGTDPDSLISARGKSTVESFLGMPLEGNTLKAIIWDYMTAKADPDGLANRPPLVPGMNQQITMRCGGMLHREKFDPLQHNFLLTYEQHRYREVRQDSIDGKFPEADFYLHYLGFQVNRKYRGIDWRKLIPSDLPQESPLKDRSTQDESFNQGDSSTLGPVQTWTEVASDFSTATNQVQLDTNNAVGDARASGTVDGADHFGELDVVDIGTISTNSALIGPAARFASGAETLVTAFPFALDSKIYLRELVAGTPTDLGTPTAITPSLTETYKVDCDGSDNANAYQAGTLRIGPETTTVTSGNQGGMYAFGDGHVPVGDIWHLEDLAAAAARRYSPIIF